MKACFIGHKNIEINEETLSLLKETTISLINKGVTTFLFGSKSEFDALSLNVVSIIKESYPFIKRVYVRSCYQFIDEPYEKYLLKSYDETYFPAKIKTAGKYSYVERNFEMIDKSTYCIFYYNTNYCPPEKVKQDTLQSKMRNSGTKLAYEYAVKKKKIIINLYQQ